MYLKRVRGNLFTDHGFLKDAYTPGINLTSSGLDLIVDFNVLRLPLEFNAGIRFTYLWNYYQQILIRPLILGVEF